ncbi:hypothetical protein DDB_G0284893 [Dictyostelium discoideum AX4]|uniref:Ion transport domain-containing protein n=1 Tax=Dictyostelium discoideum TaxID=44689 RepID=Q54P03_DICDI|nr:hypothetical protein DDB_G0284893 [Dictyostelium discoideum AX4]EAL64910.1 hypothetical protein DDB_G0284893 [Dictyostelium discoideum AX4]|eukprot:XP_639914.1 hypothetical protein DDB_G0284893 [Dictyostelium discoideum AX4]
MSDSNFKDLDSSDIIGSKSNLNIIRSGNRLSPSGLSPNMTSLNSNTSIGNNSGNANNLININGNNNINNGNQNTPNSIRVNNNNNNNNNGNNNNINNGGNNSLNPNDKLNNNNNNNNNINNSFSISDKNLGNNNNNNNNNGNINGNNNNSILTNSMGSEGNLSDLPPLSANYGHSTSHFESNFDNYMVHDRQCSTYADRVLFSNKYYYSYIVMILLNLILIIWLITNLIKKNTSVPSHWIFIVLDILVNVTLSVEIILQIISQKKKYFQTWANRFDLFVLVISICGLFLYFHSSSSDNYDYEGVVIIFLTAIRYFFQFLRLIALINRQKLKKSTFNSRVDFTELRENDIDFEIDSADDF